MKRLSMVSLTICVLSFQAVAANRAQVRREMTNEVIISVKSLGDRNADARVHTFANYALAKQFFKVVSSKKIIALGQKDSESAKEILVKAELNPGITLGQAEARLKVAGVVNWIAPNYRYVGDPRDTEFTPNDPMFGQQYHHSVMTNPAGWSVTKGIADIVVAVTDDGVSVNHEDLRNQIWVNGDEIPNNNIDDDQNGYVDDINGWDFSSDNNDPTPNNDFNDHGTHVAGIIAAQGDNSIGVTGTAPNVKIMALQFYGNGEWTSEVIARTYAYAADNGAKIISTSYAIDGFWGDRVFEAGVQYAHDKGVLHFNSAGNNSEKSPMRTKFTQMIFVGSTIADGNSNDMVSDFSNYGLGVDVFAPGGGGTAGILSTVNSGYDRKDGTSMATPNAAAVAALIWSHNPTWNRDQVAAQLAATCDNVEVRNPNYMGMMGAGRVGTNRSLVEATAAPRLLRAQRSEEMATLLNVYTANIFAPESANNLTNYELVGAGVDRTFGTGDDINVSLSLNQPYRIGSNWLEFVIGNVTPGLYRFTAKSARLVDPFGTQLDGDADGSAGGDYMTEITL